MNTATENLFNEISQAYITKLNAQDLDPKFLQNLFKDLFKKVIFVDSTKPIQQPQKSPRDEDAGDSFSKQIKKAFYELTQEQQYVTKYKQFIEKVFNTSKLTAAATELEPKSNNILDFFTKLFSSKDAEQETKIASNISTPLLSQEATPDNNFREQIDPKEIVTPDNDFREQIDPKEIVTPDNDFREQVTISDNEEGRADLIEAEAIKVHIDDITSQGENAFVRVFTPLLENVLDGFAKTQAKDTKEEKKKETTDQGIFSDIAKEFTQLASVFKILGPAFKTLGPMLAKIAGPIAAIAGGEFIGGQIGKMIGSNETISKFLYGSETAGKEAYEKYGTGITGLTRASIDLYQQSKENKETEERGKRLQQEGLERSKQSLEGTKVSQDTQAHQEATEKITAELKQAEEHKAKMDEQLKVVEEKGFFERDWGELDQARENVESANYIIQTLKNRLEKLQEINPTKNENKSQIPKSSEPPKLMKDGGLVTKPINAIVGEAGPEIVIPLSKSISNGLQGSSTPDNDGTMPLNKVLGNTDNTFNNSALKQIVDNTKGTNNALKNFGDALSNLVRVLDKKMSTNNGSTTIINAQNGSKQQIPPASQVADNNNNAIRSIRERFRKVQFE